METHCPEHLTECPHAEESARRAVKMVFSILGVDVDDPAKVEEFRKSLRWSDSMRKGAEHGFIAFIGVIAVAVSAAIWAGIIQAISSGHR